MPPATLLRLVLVLTVAASADAVQKPDTWTELTSAHFTVHSNGGEKMAARIAVQFEQIRDVFLKIGRGLRVDPGQPILILAAKDEKTLAALLPEFYQDKKRAHPSGMFIPREERNYIVLRTDAEGDFPYHTLYHEYTHQVTGLNAAFLPAWFSEGYAEFFGHSRIIGRRVSMGWAPEGSLLFLQQSRLLPLEELFRVDHDSPHYNETNKVNVFYGQSWALVHMLFTDPEFREKNSLSDYLRHVNEGRDSLEAARLAFGDLARLQRRLEGYIRSGRYYHFEMDSPVEEIEKAFSVRVTSEAETAALFGGYHLAREQPGHAKEWLDRAVRLQPDLAAAHEGLGMLHVQAGEYDLAAPYLQRAVQLNSRSFLTYYYHANSLLRSGPGDEAALAAAEQSYQRCIELNRNFAPAYAGLAQLYGRRPGSLDRALQAARTAASLDPASWHNQLTLAITLAENDRFGEARKLASRIAAKAAEPEAARSAASALDFITQKEQYEAQRRRYQEETSRLTSSSPDREPVSTGAAPVPTSATGAPVLRRRDPAGPAGESPEDSTPVTTAPAGGTTGATPLSTGRAYSMRGQITLADCSAAPEVTLTLTMATLNMKLHAADISDVAVFDRTGAPQSRRLTCAELRGMAARLQYTLTPGQSYDGEILGISPEN